MLNKARQLIYLSHLGIDSYRSRKPLAGAAPSVWPHDSLLARPQTTKPTSATAPATQRRSPPQAAPTLAEIETHKTVTDVTAPIASVSAVEGVSFCLNCWRINDKLLVLDTHEPGAALPTDTLLLNIVRSIGYAMTRLPPIESLRWPLFNDDRSADNAEQARAMVQAYVQAQVSKTPAQQLLLMGRDAARFTLDQYDNWASAQGNAFQQWQMTLIVIPSLACMLREPSLKPITWQALRPLLQRSTGSGYCEQKG